MIHSSDGQTDGQTDGDGRQHNYSALSIYASMLSRAKNQRRPEWTENQLYCL